MLKIFVYNLIFISIINKWINKYTFSYYHIINRRKKQITCKWTFSAAQKNNSRYIDRRKKDVVNNLLLMVHHEILLYADNYSHLEKQMARVFQMDYNSLDDMGY